MKIYSVEFVNSIFDLRNLQQQKIINLPQIAFFGKSNVGKSSLIANLLKKKIVKISSKPGKTTFFNFFLINKQFYIIDLPGYGYAKAPLKLKKNWEIQFKILLTQIPQLKLIIHLLDFRHQPTKLDYYYHQLIKNANTSYIIIATKADKIAKTKRQTLLKQLETSLTKSIFPYSIKEKKGGEEVLFLINKVINS